MITPPQVRAQFSQQQPHVELVGRRVRDTVLAFCDEHGYAFAARPKQLESIAEKIETGRFHRWSELDDLYACTIVIPTLREEDAVIGFLNSAFEQSALKRRGTTLKAPDVFRFEATRFIGRMRRADSTLAMEPLYQILFEVQVRTAFEHAWSVTTHALVYKTKMVDWKRLRLAAQLKAAVEQLDSLILAFAESAEHISAHEWPDVSARILVADFFERRIAIGQLPPEAAPKDWSRFTENFVALLRSSKRVRSDEVLSFVKSSLIAVGEAIDLMSGDKFPRSISLFQFVFGTLAKAEIVTPRLERFFPLVTDELKMIYPEAAAFAAPFIFDQ